MNPTHFLLCSVFAALVSLWYPVYAQNVSINGTVVDRSSGEPLPYVNIGILGTRLGTVSNEFGSFTLNTEQRPLSDTVRFSYIGYQTLNLTLRDLADSDTVYMVAVRTQMEEITVQSRRKGRTKKYGHTSFMKGGVAVVGWQQGDEIGTVIDFGDPVYVTKAFFEIEQTVGDSMHFRVNVYDYSNGKVGPNLLQENVYLKEKQRSGTFSVDLKRQNLILNTPVLLSLEKIRVDGEDEANPLLVRSVMKGSGGFYMRDGNHSININDEFRSLLPNGALQFYFEGARLK
jgi:hypothetical protein